MAINTSTVETNLTTKLNATSGTTDAKEFLLLGKAVEALTPTVTVNSVITEGNTQVARVTTEGNTQVAAVQAAASGYAQLSGATFTGAIDMGSNNITTTGKILYSNVYSQLSDLPSASTYHGMFAHVHGTGKGYFAHGGNWIPLVNEDTSGNVALGGNLTVTGDFTVNGTTTTINSTTMDVDDLNITVASGAANAAAANGAGISVDGANATLTYASASDNWNFNKGLDITTELSQIATISEQVHIDTGTGGTTALDMKTGKAVVYFTNNQASNAQINFRGDGSTTLDSLLAVGDSVTAALIYTQGGTAYYVDAIQVDGTTANVTTKWIGGAPTGGNTNALDSYSVTIIKTASGTFTALASLAKYE